MQKVQAQRDALCKQNMGVAVAINAKGAFSILPAASGHCPTRQDII